VSRTNERVALADAQSHLLPVNFVPSWQIKRFPIRSSSDHAAGGDAAVLVGAGDWTSPKYASDRFHDVFEHRCSKFSSEAAYHKAVDYGEVAVTYAELRDRANRVARFFESRGVGPGARIGLLLDRSIDSYAAVLAASKVGAAYVPLDTSFPNDRIRFMLEDSAVSVVITLRSFAGRFEGVSAQVVALDECYGEIDQLSSSPFKPVAASIDADPLAYIIYTSGSTGRPKGVPVRQSSICNFVRIASAIYGYRAEDRVYQGMTIAFDFSFEEVWVPLCAGATLVPAPSQAKLLGSDLKEFLISRRVTALCCVPTLLATLEPDLPLLRFLLVSGEACPQDVIAKWLIPGRRVLNAYGPTETTVTATWSLIEPGKAITIGGPLPTYSIVIVEAESGKALEPGEAGEICVAGVALCDDYLNRPDQTQRAFMPDFLRLADNPSGRLYRTGDLGRINANNEIEYLGRIDTQVKIRGYRIELSEIESIARSVEGVGQAVVQPFDPDGSGTVLAAYLTSAKNGEKLDMARVDAALRAALPMYMVPAFYDQLDAIPMLPSNKADRRALPAPTGVRFAAPGAEMVEPRTAREGELALLLAEVLKLEQVSVTADFFDDLGADSLKLAAYVTAIRKQLGLRRVSMKQLYENASIASLAAVIEAAAASPAAIKVAQPVALPPLAELIPTHSPAAPASLSKQELAPPAKAEEPTLPKRAYERHGALQHRASDAARIATGAAQVLVYAVFLFAEELAMVASYKWVAAASGLADIYLRAVLTTSLVFFGTAGALIATKWIVVGRFTAEPIPIWSLRYLRFWIARRAIQLNPLNLLAGTPLYPVYLRLLGIKVGRDALILSMPPVCSDLVSVGANTAIRQDVVFPGYTAHNGYIYPGTINIGSNVLICDATVLDIFTSVGDGSQIGTTSALVEGQSVPAGTVYQGSPAEPSKSNFDRVAPCPPSEHRKFLFAAAHLAGLCLLSFPVVAILTVLLVDQGLEASAFEHGSGALAYLGAIAASASFVYFGGLLLSMLIVLIVPRLLNLFVIPEVSHPVYGVQYELARSIAFISNNPLLNTLFGDSSMIVYWLSAIGYDLSHSTQTGSNFGVDQRHHSPFLCAFNRNTLVSDGLMMLNMETSATSFILHKVTMPPDTYVGNIVHYPAGAQMGPNCLIATKAAIPIDGPAHTDVGLLGSPPFVIPRSVVRDQRFDHFKQPGILAKRLAMKLRSNLVTLGLYLLRSWVLAVIAILLSLGALHAFGADNVGAESVSAAFALTLATLAFVIIAALFSILCEDLVTGFRKLEPRYCSLYDPAFWSHERYWKLNYNAFLALFDGTPMKPWFLKLQGTKVGRGVFDDGAGLTEPSMVEIGDDCMLNFRSHIQCHSLEDGTFKSDRIRLGRQCTLGTNAFVHYGSHMQDFSVLEADAFLMKGSVMEQGTRWVGNPARDGASSRDELLIVAKGAKKW
jgi:non-ribosomal peptide synthetase-like protein